MLNIIAMTKAEPSASFAAIHIHALVQLSLLHLKIVSIIWVDVWRF